MSKKPPWRQLYALAAPCCQVHGEEMQALTTRLVEAFIVGEPDPSQAPRSRYTGA
jgi:hypothetical protein